MAADSCIRVGSNELMHSPGMLRYFQSMYQTGKGKEKIQAVNLSNLTFFRGHDAQAAEDLLTGKLAHKIDGDGVLIAYEGDAYKVVEVKVTLLFEAEVSDEDVRKLAEAIANPHGPFCQKDGQVWQGWGDDVTHPQVSFEIV